ncbi:class I SAM-dependent methyltransferase [bacterium]|nr:class I SAM-dependent methyltransferase [bacterium]
MNIGFIIRYLEKRRMEEALKYISEGDLHLDIGCGNGILLRKSPCKKVMGFDKKDGERAEEKLLTYRDGQFDYITMLAVLEHLDEPELVLKQCCRLLKPNGRLIMTMNKKFADPLTILFSSRLRDDHNRYLSLREISEAVGSTHRIAEYHSFELGLNQLIIIKRKSESSMK